VASNTVYDAVQAYLLANWTTTPLAFENEQFDKPEPTSPFVAVEMTGVLYAQQSIGEANQASNRWDEEGNLWLHVFVPVDTGSSLARQYCKTLCDLFRGLQLLSGNLEFIDASIGLGEPGDENGQYYRISCNIEWRRWNA
jgi:hypothetical protein